MGLQHSLAMVAGIATSGGLLIAGDACFAWQKDSEMCAAKSYMVSAAWMASGFLTILQVSRRKIAAPLPASARACSTPPHHGPNLSPPAQVFRAKILGTPFYLGTGMISVMGTSFTFLPIAREMVRA